MRSQIANFRLWFFGVALSLSVAAAGVLAQEVIPSPGPAKSVNIPAVNEIKLKNGLTVAVIEKKGVPIVSAQLVVKSGASSETIKNAGLANLTAALMTKGTKTRTAEQIAEEMEFLGGTINSGAGWNNTTITIGVTSDKLDQAMAIMADAALNPSFKKEELDLLKSQTLDDLKYNLTQPGFLANYVASVYSNGEHPAGGTPASIEAVSQADVASFYSKSFVPGNSVLIFTGDISPERAASLAEKLYGGWVQPKGTGYGSSIGSGEGTGSSGVVKRILVVDLPNSGQAAVNYFKPVNGVGRSGDAFYSASVLNSLLGGGYSSRLNQEIRIKRGLSYGAGSGFAWRGGRSNFSARAQTKNESAAQVAELVVAELKRLAETDADAAELSPRKLVLTGGFGRNLEASAGLAGALGDLYAFGLPTSELNHYMAKVNAVSNSAVKSFASQYLYGGDLIIVGDYSVFKDDLAKRFPNMKVNVVKASELNLDSGTLKGSDIP